MDKKRRLISLFLILFALFFLIFYNAKEKHNEYIQNTGKVFGTYYNIRYQHPEGKDLQKEIEQRLLEFNSSLSTFDSQSVISRINKNDTVTVDTYFEQMYMQAYNVSKQTNGAFDITVAPLVNAWGFGFSEKENISPELIDSLLQITGYTKVRLENKQIVKDNSAIMLDASAIAKGYGCDVAAALLQENGCQNYLVEIGGEIVSRGKNAKGKPWRIGVNKPIDDPTNTTNEIETILQLTDACIATSGNYRQFYFQDGKKYAHTIDPRTGYPVMHNLLSATVAAPTCMQADALATACMVLGVDSSLALCKNLNDVECFLIYATESGELQTTHTNGFDKFLK